MKKKEYSTNIGISEMAEAIEELYQEMRDILKIPKSRRSYGNPLARITNFKEGLNKTMKFWPRDALDHMVNEEDKEFLQSMMGDRAATMAGVDKRLANTENKVSRRKEQEKKRSEKEKLRRKSDENQLVNSTQAIAPDPSEADPTNADDVDTMSYVSGSHQSRTVHHRPNKTGVDIHIPHDILKSTGLVSTAVCNKISPTALAATVTLLVEACKWDTSRISLSAAQSYRYIKSYDIVIFLAI